MSTAVVFSIFVAEVIQEKIVTVGPSTRVHVAVLVRLVMRHKKSARGLVGRGASV